MVRVLKCGAVVPDCPEEITGATDEEVLQKAAEHARTAHGLQQVDEATARTLRAAIESRP
jgi:predicted small metal-binding protein